MAKKCHASNSKIVGKVSIPDELMCHYYTMVTGSRVVINIFVYRSLYMTNNHLFSLFKKKNIYILVKNTLYSHEI